MKNFEIWVEGYMATGESGKAMLFGNINAGSFDEAVAKLLEIKPSLKPYYNYNEKTGTHSYWGCRMFDNENEARSSFG